MPRKIVGLEFLRFEIDMSAANTYTEVEIATPVGRSNNQAMLIHEVVVYDPNGFDNVAHGDRLAIQVSRNKKTAISNFYDTDILYMRDFEFLFTTSGLAICERIIYKDFPVPIVYAKSKMFFGVVTAGQGAAHTNITGYIGYTIETLAKDDFLEALVD